MPHPRHFDSIMVGGGAAGLSLAYRLSQRDPDRSLLIVDEQVKNANDHTWCYWSRESTDLDHLAYRTWDRLSVIGPQGTTTLTLAPYRYHMLRAIDFYRFIRSKLALRHNVSFLLGTVADIADGAPPDASATGADSNGAAEVVVNEIPYTGTWIFDSRYRADSYRPLTQRHHYLIQHFLGWEIEADRPALDPTTPRLFDFRTPQAGSMCFLYVLPYSETQGLVEYTVFSDALLPVKRYRQALRSYLETKLGLTDYRVTGEERDLIPMTDHPYPRRAGNRILDIGTRGGRVKPSSGYAFRRIQLDASAIARSLATHGHPFDLPSTPRRYRWFDSMLLQILHRHGELGAGIFTQLFMRNPVQRIFRFLDEEDGVLENLKVMLSVPPVPFLRAGLRLAVLRRP